MAKDLFSHQSETYAKYRPTYPQSLFDYILSFVHEKQCAWDCATGNGQAAAVLADYFEKVEASDLSAAQISNAVEKKNISYHACPAEQTPFADNSFGLITVATAYHWLNWKDFHREATRVGKKGCVIAVWAYNLFSTNDPAVNRVIDHFYHDITKAYWDDERKYVDNSYASVEFDFDPLPSRDFDIQLNWNKDHFTGYLESWSAVQKYRKENASSPIGIIRQALDAAWKDGEVKAIHFPLFLRIGRIVK